jgi:hypothetical protein
MVNIFIDWVYQQTNALAHEAAALPNLALPKMPL